MAQYQLLSKAMPELEQCLYEYYHNESKPPKEALDESINIKKVSCMRLQNRTVLHEIPPLRQ